MIWKSVNVNIIKQRGIILNHEDVSNVWNPYLLWYCMTQISVILWPKKHTPVILEREIHQIFRVESIDKIHFCRRSLFETFKMMEAPRLLGRTYRGRRQGCRPYIAIQTSVVPELRRHFHDDVGGCDVFVLPVRNDRHWRAHRLDFPGFPVRMRSSRRVDRAHSLGFRRSGRSTEYIAVSVVSDELWFASDDGGESFIYHVHVLVFQTK